MKNVRIIPAIPKENKKLKVAAYCRVSTSGPAQLRSLELQVRTYTKMILEKRVSIFLSFSDEEYSVFIVCRTSVWYNLVDNKL